MQFHRHAADRQFYMIETLLAYAATISGKHMSETAYIITRRIDPDIHITRDSGRRVWVHHSVALPLQYGAVIPCVPHLIIYVCRSLIEHSVAHPYLLVHSEPTHQHAKWRCYDLRQSLYAIKHDADKRLPSGEIIKSIPVEAAQCRAVHKLLALIKPQRELDETKINAIIHHSYAKSHASLMHKDVPKK